MPFIHTKPRYSINDLVDLLGVGRTTIHMQIKEGRIKTYRAGGRVFIDPDDLDSYIKLCRDEGDSND